MDAKSRQRSRSKCMAGGAGSSPKALAREGRAVELLPAVPQEPLTHGSHHGCRQGTCRAARAAQSCTPCKGSLRRGGTPSPPLYTPQPELTLSSQQVHEAGWAGGSHGSSRVQHANLQGNGQAAKMQLLAWKRARTLELTPCARRLMLHDAGLMKNGHLKLNSSRWQVTPSLPTVAASRTVHPAN